MPKTRKIAIQTKKNQKKDYRTQLKAKKTQISNKIYRISRCISQIRNFFIPDMDLEKGSGKWVKKKNSCSVEMRMNEPVRSL